MRLAASLCVLLLLGCGRAHIQREGSYRLSLDRVPPSPDGVVRDDCGLKDHPDVLRTVALSVSGDVVRMDHALFGIELVGFYQAASEMFSADGSTANVIGTVAGRECLLDLVTVHLDGRTTDAEHFVGTQSVTLDSRRPDCSCELWLAYTAEWAPLVDGPGSP